MRQLIRTYSITGSHEITITGYTFTKQDIRLIINETAASSAASTSDLLAAVLVSSTKKSNVVSVVNGVITLASTTANLTVGDDLTIEIDIAGGDQNAKALAEFFGLPQALPSGYEFMTDTEVTDELEDIMQVLDPELTAEQAASITAEAMQIINDDEEQS